MQVKKTSMQRYIFEQDLDLAILTFGSDLAGAFERNRIIKLRMLLLDFVNSTILTKENVIIQEKLEERCIKN